MSAAKSRVAPVSVLGPLARYAPGFTDYLTDKGYTALSRVNQLRLVGHLSNWLTEKRLGVNDLNSAHVEEFLLVRRAAGYRAMRTSEALLPLLDFLRASGVVFEPAEAASKSAVELVLDSFGGYLLSERALAASTAAAYLVRVDRFLAGCAADGDLSKVTAGDVTRAVLDESRTRSVGSVQFFVVAVRAFLRFCCQEGLVDVDLSAAAPAMTGRRTPVLPRGIGRRDVQALLASCDRRQATGRRDHAVLLLLIRLGLRAGEVARLRLEDIDWHTGQIMVRGKGGRQDLLPLPVDVGESVAGYLQRGRPKTVRREVFLTVIAPLAGLTRGSVSTIVRAACLRTGVAPIGAHRLRHTLACDMVAAGTPLPEIGQVLRHRHLSSTTIYAKADIVGLRTLALPWPGGPR